MNIYVLLVLMIIVFIAWAEIMFHFAGKDKKTIFGLIFGLGIIGLLTTTLLQLFVSTNAITIFAGAIGLFFIIFWGTTLYEQAGNKEKSWYYLTLILPFLAIVYQIVNK